MSDAGTTPAVDVLAGWAVPGERGATILNLEEPVELGAGVVFTRLVIAKLKAKHLRVMRDDTLSSKLAVLVEASGESTVVIDNLCVADMLRALEVVNRGFPDGPATGGAS